MLTANPCAQDGKQPDDKAGSGKMLLPPEGTHIPVKGGDILVAWDILAPLTDAVAQDQLCKAAPTPAPIVLTQVPNAGSGVTRAERERETASPFFGVLCWEGTVEVAMVAAACCWASFSRSACCRVCTTSGITASMRDRDSIGRPSKTSGVINQSRPIRAWR
ncbi:hypothetical protein JZ751_027787 [Albula glossodonta]|uniref:Uncharacterized protein n=1 Tax=Albula glossodonta TaxID=121402 RepID=A0A8T2P9P3_9TELE|nr:hypothetical protein JZ751_027787 [Albula glossodonta]